MTIPKEYRLLSIDTFSPFITSLDVWDLLMANNGTEIRTKDTLFSVAEQVAYLGKLLESDSDPKKDPAPVRFALCRPPFVDEGIDPWLTEEQLDEGLPANGQLMLGVCLVTKQEPYQNAAKPMWALFTRNNYGIPGQGVQENLSGWLGTWAIIDWLTAYTKGIERGFQRWGLSNATWK